MKPGKYTPSQKPKILSNFGKRYKEYEITEKLVKIETDLNLESDFDINYTKIERALEKYDTFTS